VGHSLTRLGLFVASVKKWGRSTLQGPKYGFPKAHFVGIIALLNFRN